MKQLMIAFSAILFLSGCTKTEGTGGAASVKGTIMVEEYNNFGTLLSTYPAQDHDVFIIYGSGDNIVDDDLATSYDGSFEFKYLRKGTYTAFVYSDCRNCDSGDSTVKITFEVDAKKDEIDLSKITIYKY